MRGFVDTVPAALGAVAALVSSGTPTCVIRRAQPELELSREMLLASRFRTAALRSREYATLTCQVPGSPWNLVVNLPKGARAFPDVVGSHERLTSFF